MNIVARENIVLMVLLAATVFFSLSGYCLGTGTIDDLMEEGKSLLKRGQDIAALERFNEVLAVAPVEADQHQDALYLKGQALLFMGREKEALQVLKSYLDGYPQGKYRSEALLISKGFKSQSEYRESPYGRFLESRIGTVLSIVYLLIWLYAVSDVAKGKLPTCQKAIWILLVFSIPFLGIMVYFWVKRYGKLVKSW